MGQYYRASLYDETTNEHFIFDLDGCKMMEHAYYGNSNMLRVEKFLLWKSFRVLRVGDYAQCRHLVRCPECNVNKDSEELEREEGKIYFLVNHTRKEFINLNKGETLSEIHPLPLLTKADWWIGGGDYRSETNFHYVWEWCGDKICLYDYWEEYLDKSVLIKEYEDCTEKYVFIE